MARRRMMKWVRRVALILAPGAAMLAVGCTQKVQDALISGGLSFVKGAAEDILSELLPITELL